MTRRDPGLPQPPEGNHFPAAPMLYPRLLRRVADALDALNAFGDPDPAGQESSHWLASHAIAVYDEEAADDNDELADLVGWLTLIDHNCWVFVPHLSGLALERLTAVGRDLPRARLGAARRRAARP